MGCEPRLRYVITGPGRSGTTFLAHVFLNAGYDLGDVHPSNIGDGFRTHTPIGGGLEYRPFTLSNNPMKTALQNGRTPEDIARKHSAVMRGTPWPEVMKDPRYLYTYRVWEADGMRPTHLFLCVRNADVVRRSSATIPTWTQDPHERFSRTYELLVYCLEHDIPYTLVLYPRIGRDRAYAECTLSSFIAAPWAVIRNTWDESLEHFGPPFETAQPKSCAPLKPFVRCAI